MTRFLSRNNNEVAFIILVLENKLYYFIIF
jgi:hypothetical protein